MDSLFQALYDLITSEAGSLTYQLILAFSVAGALMATLSHWNRSDDSQVKRMVFGLSALLALRVVVFFVAALVWQGVVLGDLVLPIIDRGITLLSLVIIIWLWAFPTGFRLADSAAVILGLLVVTVTVFGALWWNNLGAEGGFNGSPPGRAAEIAALSLIALGIVILIVRRPGGWIFGLLMLGIEGAGHVVQLLYPASGADYASAVRLAQMIAYPLLFLLPQRLPAAEPAARESAIEGVGRDEAAPPISGDKWGETLAPDLLELLSSTSFEESCRLIARITSLYMQADICLVAVRDDESHQVQVKCGYDSRSLTTLPGMALYPQQFPLLLSAIQRGGTVRLPTSSASPDVANISHLYGLDNVGHMLSRSVVSSGGDLMMVVILLSPYTDRRWSVDDEGRIESLVPALARFLHHNQQYTNLQKETLLVRQDLGVITESERRLRDERQKFQDFLELFESKVGQEGEYIDFLAALQYSLPEVQKRVSSLLEENEAIQQLVQLAKELPPVKRAVDLDEELQRSKSEVILLKTALSEAEGNVMALKAKSLSGELSGSQFGAVFSLAQELRRSAASISEYARFLLGESLGELDEVQRKMLLRVQGDAGRMDNLALDLIVTVSKEPDALDQAYEAVNISPLIDQAVAGATRQMRERDLSLSLDIASDLPLVCAKPDLLGSILENMLLMGVSMFPHGAQLRLSVGSRSAESGSQFVDLHLVDVSDASQGELPEFPDSADGAISGESQPGEEYIYVLETLLEELNGRVWVDGAPGQAKSINLILPVKGNIIDPDTASVSNPVTDRIATADSHARDV